MPSKSISRPAGVLTVPFGVVDVCHAGTSFAEPQSNVTVPPRFGSRTLDALLGELAAISTIATHRRAGALRDRDGVADVVGVAVGEQDRRRRRARRRWRRPSGCRSGTGRSSTVVSPSRQRERGVAEEAQLHRHTPPSSLVSICQRRARARTRRRRRRACPARLLGDERADRRLALGAGPRRRPPRAPPGSCAAPNQPPAASASSSTRWSAGRGAVTISCACAQPLGVAQRRDGGVDLARRCRRAPRRAIDRRPRLAPGANAAPADSRAAAPASTPVAPASASAVSTATGSSSSTTANAAAPSRSPSTSRPRRASRRSGIAHATSSASAAPLPPSASGKVSSAAATAIAAGAAARNSSSDDERAVPALEQPAEERDREQRDERVAAVVVDERRGRPRATIRRRAGRRPPTSTSRDDGRLRQHEQHDARRARARSWRTGAHRRGCRGSRRAAAARATASASGASAARRLRRATVAIELRRPLAQAVAAVRALGDVRADLGAAVLADHEEIGCATAHAPILERMRSPSGMRARAWVQR